MRDDDSHRDENSAPNQYDPKQPRPIEQERPMATPAVSQRTADAQFPPGETTPQVSERHTAAAGMPAARTRSPGSAPATKTT